MKEIIVISGKGGTGKTSILASLAVLAKPVVVADCDVDAADLHLLLSPEVLESNDFLGGAKVQINPRLCTACGKCAELCRFEAISLTGVGNEKVKATYRIDPIACEGCGVCVHFCSEKAIEMTDAVNGQWFVSQSRVGPMVHAKLNPAEENSGKLVTIVRNRAREIASKEHIDTILVDGAPGVGCPVIASITGADIALIITEPTLSGLHDMKRVAELAGHFGLERYLCINKWDINPELTEQISETAKEMDISVLGKVRYDPAITQAQVENLSVIEYTTGGVCDDIRELWLKLADIICS